MLGSEIILTSRSSSVILFAILGEFVVVVRGWMLKMGDKRVYLEGFPLIELGDATWSVRRR